MKILHLNGADIEGGAARAGERLLKGIRAEGLDARLIVQRKFGNDPLVDGPVSVLGKALNRLRPTLEQLLCGLTPGMMQSPFCAALLPDGLSTRVAAMAPSIIHLHWVARMIRLETLARFSIPLVWTLHDSWPFTGGCYLPGDCSRYRESCGGCPALGSSREKDLSRRIWQRKRRAWERLNLTIVAPSRWMADSARSSSLFRDKRIEVIPNGIDTELFGPCDKRSARDGFSLPQDKKLILFGAKSATRDRNKGFHLLEEALKKLAATTNKDGLELVVFGSAEQEKLAELGFSTHCLGWQDDEISLAQLYSAADLFVMPSIQESLGYTVMEAMACGTPCVAFNQGGVPDLIDHGLNGYLAHPYEPADLAHGIAWILEDEEHRNLLSRNARRKIERINDVTRIARLHAALYEEILAP